MRTLTHDIAKVLDGPHATPWLRQALQSALNRDPVEAANDAKRLSQLLLDRVEALVFLDHWQRSNADDLI